MNPSFRTRRRRALLLGIPIAAALACAGCGSPEERPPDVLLVTIDTLRADSLTPYDRTRRTPHLARLAARSQVYERALAPMPLTRPSHFSMLTGLYPREHGVVNNRLALPAELPTFAAVLGDHGYQTAAVVGARLLVRASGLDRSFDTLRGPGPGAERRAEPVVAEALEVLEQADPERPLLLWIHVFDPHRPYDPPAPHRDGLAPELAARLPKVTWPALDAVAAANDGAIPRPVLDHARRLYDLEAEYADDRLGRLLEAFQERRGLDDALVIVTADHGECFENGIYFEHADCLLEGALRVPLLVHWPEARAVGRVGEPVSLVDLAPTVYREVGIEPATTLSGRALQDPPRADRPILIQHPVFTDPRHYDFRVRGIREVAGDPVAAPLGARRRFGVVVGDWKYLRTEEPGGAWSESLLRTEAAGREVSVSPAAHPDVVASQRLRLGALLRSQTARELPAGELDPELRATLEALGYLREDE